MEFREEPCGGCRQMKVAKNDVSDIVLFVLLNILFLLSEG
jgi:hypothetical protein